MSLPYDPEGDPRHIPAWEPAPDRDLERISDAIEENERELQTFREIQELFAMPGWAHLMGIVSHDGDALDKVLIKTRDIAEWKYLRGQKVWNDFILDLPAQIDAAIRRLAVKQEILVAQSSPKEN